jgi:hypothetical protein
VSFTKSKQRSSLINDKLISDKRYSKPASVAFLSRYRERSLRKRENSAACDIRTTRNFFYALNNGRSLYTRISVTIPNPEVWPCGMVPNAHHLTLQRITIKHPTLSYTATAKNIIIIIIIIIIINNQT